MYHCNLTVHIFSGESIIEKTLHSILPPERFSLAFQTYGTFNLAAVSRGDIVIVDLPLAEETTKLMQVFSDAGAWLIFCINHGMAEKSIYNMAEDIWFKPLTAEDMVFRFHKLLANLKCRKDKWLYKHYLNTVIDSIPAMVWFKDLQGAHLTVNQEFCAATGKTQEEIAGRGHYYIWDMKQEEYEKGEYVCLESEKTVIQKKELCVFIEKIKSKRGFRQFKTFKSPLFDENGEVMGTVGIAQDVTSLENMGAEQEIILRNMPFAILLKNEKGRVLNVNQRFEEYFDETKAAMLGKNYQEWVGTKLRFFGQITDEGHPMAEGNVYGQPRLFEVQELEILDVFDVLTGYFCIFKDVTMECFLKEQILRGANTDFLTDLYNRRYFYEYVATQRGDQQINLFSIDLDNFKQVNDTFGHQVGDEALIAAANCIKSIFPVDFVARLGGDEFLVVVFGVSTPSELLRRGNALLERMRNVFQASEQFCIMMASIGIAWTDEPAMDIDELLRQCDTALYEAKRQGKACCCLFESAKKLSGNNGNV